MALLEVDTEKKIAELYIEGDSGPEAWHIEFKANSQLPWEVIGAQPAQEFARIEDLHAAPLPDLVKWAARGLIGIPLNGKGK